MTDDTRQQQTVGKSLYKPEVEDSIQVRDCLVGGETKELLTLYLAESGRKEKSAVTTVTHRGVILNQPAYYNASDIMVLAITPIEKLRDNTSIIAGTDPRRRIVKLQPIYDALGENKVQAIGGCASQAISLRQAKHRGGSVSSNPMIA